MSTGKFTIAWSYQKDRCGLDWEGEKSRWLVTGTSDKVLVRTVMRVFESWYDHPYAIMESPNNRIYCGGKLFRRIMWNTMNDRMNNAHDRCSRRHT